MSPLKCSHVTSQVKDAPHVMSFIFLLTSITSMLLTGGHQSTVEKHPPIDQKDVGSNPTTVMKQKVYIGRIPAQRVCHGPTGSEWKTHDVNAEPDL